MQGGTKAHEALLVLGLWVVFKVLWWSPGGFLVVPWCSRVLSACFLLTLSDRGRPGRGGGPGGRFALSLFGYLRAGSVISQDLYKTTY